MQLLSDNCVSLHFKCAVRDGGLRLTFLEAFLVLILSIGYQKQKLPTLEILHFRSSNDIEVMTRFPTADTILERRFDEHLKDWMEK